MTDAESRKKMEHWAAHLALKRPDKMNAFRKGLLEHVGNPLREKLVALGLDPDDSDATQEFFERQCRQREIDYYSQYDLTILNELGLSLDDVLDLEEEKRKRNAATRKRPSKEPDVAKFLEIVMKCESEGLSFAQTKRKLVKQLDVTERTIHTWLDNLRQSPECDIPPPRGKG
ncbi:hypothetical protein [Rhodobacteraceae bacterium W635]|uniref:hypothetical protein n=1 Tax=Nioella halotolerans TaxID=2303578 RepID=UPI0011C13882